MLFYGCIYTVYIILICMQMQISPDFLILLSNILICLHIICFCMLIANGDYSIFFFFFPFFFCFVEQ